MVTKDNHSDESYSEGIIRPVRDLVDRELTNAIAELPLAQRQHSTVKMHPIPTKLASKLRRFVPVAVGMGISLLALSTIAYSMTHPCVFSPCHKQPLLGQYEAANQLKAAREAARTAQSSLATSQSLAELEQAEAAWQNAIGHLRKISPQARVYAEGQQLLRAYWTRLAAAQERNSRSKRR